MTSVPAAVQHDFASADDVRRILGELEPKTVLDILVLRPTVRDLEDACLFLAGDSDVFGPGNPLQSPAGDIVAVLTAEEEEEERRSG